MEVSDGAVIPEPQPNTTNDEIDPYLILELGDHVIIESAKYGRTSGKIYYRDTELI